MCNLQLVKNWQTFLRNLFIVPGMIYMCVPMHVFMFVSYEGVIKVMIIALAGMA